METRTELIVFLFSDDQYLFLLERGGLSRVQRDEERIELHTMLCAGYKVPPPPPIPELNALLNLHSL
jgi:hypothetical protein